MSARSKEEEEEEEEGTEEWNKQGGGVCINQHPLAAGL